MEIARFRSKLGAGDYFPLLNIGKMLKQCNSVCVSQLILLCVMASFAFRVSILCFDLNAFKAFCGCCIAADTHQ